MFENVKADIRRVTAGESSAGSAVLATLFHLGLHAVLLFRLSHWLHRHGLSLLGFVIGYFSGVLTGAQISRRATIGKGLSILHPQGVVIGPTVVIGEFCTLAQGNTVGQLRGTNDRPTIGDHFFAGSGAKILGQISIGNGVRIGANSVVMRSLPDHVAAIGLPARIVMQRIPSPIDLATCSRETILEHLTGILRNMGPDPATIDEQTLLIGGGINLDSIGLVQLVCAIEEDFGVSVDLAKLPPAGLRTIGSVVTLIEHRRNAG